MAIQYKENRQKPRAGFVRFLWSDAPNGVFTPLFEVPGGAILLTAAVHVLTPGNGGTSEVLDLGTSGSANSLANDVNAKVAARTALTLPNAPTTGRTVYGVTRGEGGTAATAGVYGVSFSYIVESGSESTQG